MKKSWKPYFLILVLLSPFMVQLAIVSNYFVQIAAYEKYCINKDKPSLECHGKCKMQEELNAVDMEGDANQKNIPITIKVKESTLYVLQDFPKLFSELTIVKPFVNQCKNLFFKLICICSIFQPPEFRNC